jgi:MFS superfamily sulfate permease-like transporter
VEVVRVESGLFFANAEFIRTHIRGLAAKEGTRAVIIDAETIPFIDITSVRMLDELGEDLASTGVRFALAKDIGQVRDLLPSMLERETSRCTTPIDEAVTAMTAEKGP